MLVCLVLGSTRVPPSRAINKITKCVYVLAHCTTLHLVVIMLLEYFVGEFMCRIGLLYAKFVCECLRGFASFWVGSMLLLFSRQIVVV